MEYYWYIGSASFIYLEILDKNQRRNYYVTGIRPVISKDVVSIYLFYIFMAIVHASWYHDHMSLSVRLDGQLSFINLLLN